MAGPAILKIDIIADASKAASGLRKIGDATAGTPEKLNKTSGAMQKLKGVAIVAGAAIGGALVGMFKVGFDEQKDFLAGQAQLKNGLKTTGNAAHTSVGHLENLASSVQNYSGQTDDSIVSSEKLLLTFTKIGNHAGKNNDIFDQATKITADMAAKMGGDASKYAVQLGKALNDPVKGISALSRVGVSFDDSQKKTIKQMVATGNTMGAQKIIMGELRKEFGGSAKAYGDTLPGQMDRAKRSFEDISQNLVASFMPIISQLADILMKDVMPAFSAVMGFITKNKSVFGILAGAILAIVAAVKIWTGVQTLFNVVMAANPLMLIVIAIIALVAIIVIAYKKSATFRKIVQTAFKVVAATAKVMWNVLKTVFTALWKFLVFVGKLWFTVYVKPWLIAYQILKAAITTAVSWIKTAFTALVSAIGRIFTAVTRAITAPFRAAWDWVKNTLIPALKTGWDGLVSAIGRALKAVTAAITAPFRAAWSWIHDTLIPAFKAIWTTVSGAVSRALSTVAAAIKAPFKAAWDWIRNNVITPLRNAFTGLAGAITHAVSGVWRAITAPFDKAWTWIKTHLIDPVVHFFTNIGSLISGGVRTVVNGIVNALNSLLGLPWVIKIHIPIPLAPDVNFGPYTVLPRIPTMARGAFVDRATLAVVGEGRGGEFVAPESMLRKLIRDEIGQSGVHITVNGALDPDAVARQIERLLVARNRRTSGVRRIGTVPA